MPTKAMEIVWPVQAAGQILQTCLQNLEAGHERSMGIALRCTDTYRTHSAVQKGTFQYYSDTTTPSLTYLYFQSLELILSRLAKLEGGP